MAIPPAGILLATVWLAELLLFVVLLGDELSIRELEVFITRLEELIAVIEEGAVDFVTVLLPDDPPPPHADKINMLITKNRRVVVFNRNGFIDAPGKLF